MLLQSQETEVAQLLAFAVTSCATCTAGCKDTAACDAAVFAGQVLIKGDNLEQFACRDTILPY